MTPSPEKPATAKQLRYLRHLALRTGQTFTPPATRGEASRHIARLRAVRGIGMSFAELEAEQGIRERHGDVPLYAPAVDPDEITGYGAGAHWRHT